MARTAQSAPEEPLHGGNMNTVVRIGDVVVRSGGPWTPTIHRLLDHVRNRGVTWVPEPLGIDELGRERLSFRPGLVPSYPLPRWVWAEAILVDAARRLRQLHDATLDFQMEAAIWRIPSHETIEVICHNDFAPYNFVCNEGHIDGVIDFDVASPGPRIWDVAYLAYRLCPLASAANRDATIDGEPFPVVEQERRLRRLIAAYGAGFLPREVIQTAVSRLVELAVFTDEQARAQSLPDLSEHARLYRADAAELRARLASSPPIA
jgi:hypothetical protein